MYRPTLKKLTLLSLFITLCSCTPYRLSARKYDESKERIYHEPYLKHWTKEVKMTQTSKSCTIKGDITVALTYNFEKNKATEVVVWDARLFSKDKISLKVNNHTYPYILVLFYSKDEHQIADDFEIANSAEIEVNPLSQEPINIYKIDLTGFKKLRHECQVYINDASINPNHKSQ